jgi:hypothetical protein
MPCTAFCPWQISLSVGQQGFNRPLALDLSATKLWRRLTRIYIETGM